MQIFCDLQASVRALITLALWMNGTTVTSVFASDSDARHDLLQSAEVLAVLAIHLIDMPHCVYYVAMSQRCSDMFLVFLHCCHGSNPVSQTPFSCKVDQS